MKTVDSIAVSRHHARVGLRAGVSTTLINAGLFFMRRCAREKGR